MESMNGNGGGGTGGKVIAIAGEMTLGQAETLRETLLGALDGTDDVRLDCGEVAAVDVVGLQLLCAAHRTAAARHKSLSLVFPLPAPLGTAIEEAGFGRLRGCRGIVGESCCLWQKPSSSEPSDTCIQQQERIRP